MLAHIRAGIVTYTVFEHNIFTYAPVKFGSQYWLMEYLDGSQWKPAFPVKSTTIAASGETISYNMSLTASKIEVFEFTAVLENQCKDFKVRMTCCSEYQVNGKWFNHPRTQSEQRIAGVRPTLKNLFPR